MNLNVGCGGNTEFQNRRTFKDSILLDIRRPIEKQQNFILASAEHLPFKNSAFETSYLIDVIEHLEKPAMAIKDLYRVTGNKAIIATPNALHGLNFLYAMKHGASKPHSDHIIVFGKAELGNLFNRCNIRKYRIEADTYLDEKHTFIGNIVSRFLPKSLRRQLIAVIWKPQVLNTTSKHKRNRETVWQMEHQ